MAMRKKLPKLLTAGSITMFVVLESASVLAAAPVVDGVDTWYDAHLYAQSDSAVGGNLGGTLGDSPATTPTQPAAPADPNDPRTRLDQALKDATQGGQKSAARELKSLTKDPEWGAYALYNLGVLAYQDGDVKKADDYIDQALQADPAFGAAAVAKVRQYLYSNDVAGARSFVQKQLAASGNAPGIRTADLYVALAQKDYQKVIRDTRAILIEDPANLDAYYALAMANLSLGRTELADYILKQANDREPNRADMLYGLGLVAMEVGDREEARRDFQKAVAINPSYPEAKVALSELQLRKMEYQAVVDALEPVTKDIPSYVDAWVNYGSGLKGTGKSADAKKAFEKALELDPRSEKATFNIGILYLDVADFEGLEYKERLNTALEWFNKYRALAGTISESDPVTAYENFIQQEVEMQEELERQDREAEERRLRREAEKKAGDDKKDGGDGDWDDNGDDWGDDDW